MENHYKTLGVPPSATPEEIRSAWRKLSRELHPDKGGNTEKFQRLQAASNVLLNARLKKEYDIQMGLFFEKCSRCGGTGRVSRVKNWVRVMAICGKCCGEGTVNDSED